MSIKCWWYGHEPDYGRMVEGGYTWCERCNDGLSYDDLVTPPPRIRVMDFFYGWLVYPFTKCEDCGKRNIFSHSECDVLPF